MTARSVPLNKLDIALLDTKRIAHMEVSMQSITDRIPLLDYESIDNEARARRNNLLIKWLPERAG